MTDTLETSAQANRPTAVGLIRVSTDWQSVEGQRAQLLAWSQREGVALDIREENAVSGAALSRPVLESILADARAKRINLVVTPALDRLGRSAVDLIVRLDELRGLKVRVVSLREGLDFGTPVGAMVAAILAYVAELERLAIGERTKAAFMPEDGGEVIERHPESRLTGPRRVSVRRKLRVGRPSITIDPATEEMIRAERAKPFQSRKTWDELAEIVRGTVTRPDGSTASVGVSDNFLRTKFG